VTFEELVWLSFGAASDENYKHKDDAISKDTYSMGNIRGPYYGSIVELSSFIGHKRHIYASV
jgi:hypothetical protein